MSNLRTESTNADTIRKVIQECLSDWEAGRPIQHPRLLAERFERMPELDAYLTGLLRVVGSVDDLPTGDLSVSCPQCHHRVSIERNDACAELTCANCGSTFHVLGDSWYGREAKPQEWIGQFELESRIGVGAFGTVWKAHDTRLDRKVALKIPRLQHLDPIQSEQFLREARAAAQLQHPNIVSLYEVGRDDTTLFLVSELIEGKDLAQWMSKQTVGSEQAATICRQIANGLHHAHTHGVVHRDLKPSNVLIDAHDHPHITDFGLAKREAGEVTLTIDGNILGTPTHMAPEQARGEAHASDGRTDLYSLGVILFQMLTGELPFRGSARMLLYHVLHTDPPRPRELNRRIPRDLETICLKCLEKEPSARYASALELSEDLTRFIHGKPVRARPVGQLTRWARACRRNPLVTTLLVVTIFSLALFAIGSLQFASIATQQRNQAVAERDRNERLLDYLVDVFRRPDPTLDGRDVTVASLLEQAAGRAQSDLVEDPLALATMLDAFGRTYAGLGLNEEAAQIARRALTLQQSQLGEDHARTATSHATLGVALLQSGSFATAISHLEAAVTWRRRNLGEDHIETLDAMVALATAYNAAGRLADATPIYEQVYRQSRNLPREYQTSALEYANAYAESLKANGQLDDALPIYEKTLATMKQIQGNEYSTWMFQSNLAGAYRRSHRVAEALPLYRESLTRLCDLVGEEHPTTLTVLNNLAGALNQSGLADEALPHFEQSLRLRAKKLGDEHPSTLMARANLAHCYEVLGKIDDSIRLGEQTYLQRRRILGTEHPDTLISMNNLANSYVVVGRADEAIGLLEETVATRRKILPPGHPDCLFAIGNLAKAHSAAGDHEHAIKLGEEMLHEFRERFPEGHPLVIESQTHLAGLWEAAGDVERAIRQLSSTREAALAKLQPNHDAVLRATMRLQSLALRMRSWQLAEDMAHEVVQQLASLPSPPPAAMAVPRLGLLEAQIEQLSLSTPGKSDGVRGQYVAQLAKFSLEIEEIESLLDHVRSGSELERLRARSLKGWIRHLQGDDDTAVRLLTESHDRMVEDRIRMPPDFRWYLERCRERIDKLSD